MTILYIVDRIPDKGNSQWIIQFSKYSDRPLEVLFIHDTHEPSNILYRNLLELKTIFPTYNLKHLSKNDQKVTQYCLEFQNNLRNRQCYNLCIMDISVTQLRKIIPRIHTMKEIIHDKYGDALYLINDILIWKNIRMSCEEEMNHTKGLACDVYEISKLPHRNWRWVDNSKSIIPSIPGINSYREIDIYNIFNNASHIIPHTTVLPLLKFNVINDNTNQDLDIKRMKLNERINYKLNHLNVHYVLIQSYAGPTMYELLNQAEQNMDMKQLSVQLNRVYDNISILRECDIIHGDITPDNVCINTSNDQVRFIDFGWCTHPSFHLNDVELSTHRRNVQINFDWIHFCLTFKSVHPHYYSIIENINEKKCISLSTLI